MSTWLVICEAETGTLPNGSTYVIESAHRTIEGAETRKDDLRSGECSGRGGGRHDWGRSPVDQDFCLRCGFGWTIDEVDLEP